MGEPRAPCEDNEGSAGFRLAGTASGDSRRQAGAVADGPGILRCRRGHLPRQRTPPAPPTLRVQQREYERAATSNPAHAPLLSSGLTCGDSEPLIASAT